MRGDLGLIVKQLSLTGFDLKLTPMGTLECPYTDRSSELVLHESLICF